MTDSSALVETFVSVVSRLNSANRSNPDWWLTWLSGRDRFRSRLWDLLRSDALGEAPPQVGRIRALLQLAKAVRLAMLRIRAARRHPSRSFDGSADIILVTILNGRAVAAPALYQDTYFGNLHNALAERGFRTLYAGFTEGDADAICASARARSDVVLVTLAEFLNYRDIAAALLGALTARFVIPALPLPWGGDAGRFVRRDIENERLSIFEGRMIGTAIERLLEHHPGARLIHMYESNGWERASYMAAKRAVPVRPVTGYLHCSVLRSHMKNVLPEGELCFRPMPDVIVTTGAAPAALLQDIGQYPDGMVVPGCGLRPPVLSEIAPMRPIRRPAQSILLLLEGLVSAVPGFQMFAEAAARRPDLDWRVRCHPQLPLERLSSISGVAVTEHTPLRPSRAPSLDAAIAEADLVVYLSSTAVLTAVYGMRPAIRIDLDPVLDDDPLTKLSALKWRVRSVPELLDAIDAINSMDQSAYEQAARLARSYISDYLAAPDEMSLEPFFTTPAVRSCAVERSLELLER